LFKFTFTVVFNYLGVHEVYVGYLLTRKIVLGLGLGLKGLTSSNITGMLNIRPRPRYSLWRNKCERSKKNMSKRRVDCRLQTKNSNWPPRLPTKANGKSTIVIILCKLLISSCVRPGCKNKADVCRSRTEWDSY